MNKMTEKEYMREIGINISYYMREANMSQSSLARATGISQSTISRYISGEAMPSIKNITNIAYELCCDISDLLTNYYKIY